MSKNRKRNAQILMLGGLGQAQSAIAGALGVSRSVVSNVLSRARKAGAGGHAARSHERPRIETGVIKKAAGI